MTEIWVGLIGVVLGWGLNYLSWSVSYTKERREKHLALYQQGFAHLKQLEDTVPSATNYAAIQPLIDDFRQWWYQSGLFLDPRTNRALVGVVNTITANMLPQPQAGNILLIQAVRNAFDEAENAIRAATGQKR